jgi:hypothetical protein
MTNPKAQNAKVKMQNYGAKVKAKTFKSLSFSASSFELSL